MKRILLAALTIVVLSTALFSCARDGDVPAGMLRASDEIVDSDLFVPDGWTVDQTGGAVSAFRSKTDPTNVSVMVWNLPYADSTLEDWWETYQSEFNTVFTDFTLENTESTLLGGSAAQKYVYTASVAGHSYRYTQIASVRRGSVYLMTFTELAEISEEDAAAHAAELSEILEHFRWR